jgi:WD40 repeat protein
MLVWRGHRAKVRALAFAPDGQRITTTAGNSKFVWLWDPTTGQRVDKYSDSRRHSLDVARCITYFPAGRYLAATWERGGVTVWYTATGARASVLSNHGEELNPDTLAVSPDGSRLFGCSTRLLEWENPTARPPSVGVSPHNRTHEKLLRGTPRLGFSPKGTYFCIAEWHMHLLDGTTLEPRRVLSAPVGSASAAAFAFTPDEMRLAVAFGHSSAVWRLDEPDAPPVRCGSHGNLVRAIGFLPGGGTVLTAAMDGTVRLWDSITGAETRSFDWGIGKVQAAAVSPDGTLCAAGGDDGHIVVWDVDA